MGMDTPSQRTNAGRLAGWGEDGVPPRPTFKTDNMVGYVRCAGPGFPIQICIAPGEGQFICAEVSPQRALDLAKKLIEFAGMNLK